MDMLLVGDPHISHKRLKRSREMLMAIAKEWIQRPHVEGLVVLGDVFDEHEWIHASCASLWRSFIWNCPAHKPIWHLLGNHEMIHHSDFPAEAHALQAFKGFPDYQIVDRVMGGNGIYFAPFVPTGRFHEIAPQLPAEGGILFCHQEFKGALRADAGDEHLGNEWQVVSGHIHEPMTVGNVWYPGAPVQSNFGEADDKCIYVVSNEHGKLRVKERIFLGIKNFKTIPVEWNGSLPEGLNPEESYYRFDVAAKRSEIMIFKSSPLYRELLFFGKIKITVIPEEKAKKHAKGTTFKEALADYIAQEGLEEIANEIGA